MSDRSGSGAARRRKKKRSALFAPLSFILICAVIFFGMSVFFRVSTIDVEGVGMYTAQEVIEASGIEEGDNLFFINRFSATSQVISRLPYIERLSIERKLPNRIVISVTESMAIAYVSLEGEFWLINHSCKLLGTAAYEEAEGIIRIDGIIPVAPAVGEVLSTEDAEKPKVDYLAGLLGQISERNMQADVSWIDMSNVGNPSFRYQERFVVKTGKNESLEYKFGLLSGAVVQLSEGDSGTLDISNDKRANFMPD